MFREVGRESLQRRVQDARGIRADLGGLEFAQYRNLVELEQVPVSDLPKVWVDGPPSMFERLVDCVHAGGRVVQAGGFSQQPGDPRRSKSPSDCRPVSLSSRQRVTVARPLDVPLLRGDPHPPKVRIFNLNGARVAEEEVDDEFQEYTPVFGPKRPARGS